MKIKQRVICFGLTVLCIAMFLAFLNARLRLKSIESELRLARDVSWSFRNNSELACKSSPSAAIDYLEMTEGAQGSAPFGDILAQFVERERRIAETNIIECLRAKTGKNLGTNVQAWREATTAPELPKNEPPAK